MEVEPAEKKINVAELNTAIEAVKAEIGKVIVASMP